MVTTQALPFGCEIQDFLKSHQQGQCVSNVSPRSHRDAYFTKNVPILSYKWVLQSTALLQY